MQFHKLESNNLIAYSFICCEFSMRKPSGRGIQRESGENIKKPYTVKQFKTHIKYIKMGTCKFTKNGRKYEIRIERM